MIKRKGFIFDLDGVIVDTAKYHYQAWSNLADSLGIPFTMAQNEELKGVSRVDSLKKILTWGNLNVSEKDFQDYMDRKNENYLQYVHQMDRSELLFGVQEALALLVQHRQALAIGSASKNAKTILDCLQLMNVFDCIIDGNGVTHAKPHPEVFLNAADGLHLDPSDCVVFEDSRAGIQSAKAAKMLAIGIGTKENLPEADLIFESVGEIPHAFLLDIIHS